MTEQEREAMVPYKELCLKVAALERRVMELEAKHESVTLTWTPQGFVSAMVDRWDTSALTDDDSLGED